MANDLTDNWKIAWNLTENWHHDPGFFNCYSPLPRLLKNHNLKPEINFLAVHFFLYPFSSVYGSEVWKI